MKNILSTITVALALVAGNNAYGSVPQRADFGQYTASVRSNATADGRSWHKAESMNMPSPISKVISQGDLTAVPAASYWGSLYTPDDQEWLYTMEYNYVEATEYMQSIESADITIYDSNFKVYKTLKASFELSEGDVGINSVQIAPVLTRKFFNINDAYEVMVFVHAVTEDYVGRVYTQVYTLSDGSLVTTLKGDNIAAVNTATDEWSEKYTMVFMREETIISEDSYEYWLDFDVYSRADWGGTCTLEHTFRVDYSLLAGAGDSALPILINTRDNHIFYALPHYEKPYWVEDWSEEVTPDNHFMIDLYDENFELVKVTSIPMETQEGALFSFPGTGELQGFGDMSFDFYGDVEEMPYYIIGVENYIVSMDDFYTSLYVYDSDGNRLQTIIDNAADYIRMTDVFGHERQYCFYLDDETSPRFAMVNIPSCQAVAEIGVQLPEGNISMAIDRVANGTTYQYVSSMINGFVDAAGDVWHRIAWFKADGEIDHIDSINLGDNVALAQVYISGSALSPYLFNTDERIEYMFLVKEYVSPDTSTRTQEFFRIYNDKSEELLNMGPDQETGAMLNSIFILNEGFDNPKLVVSYYIDDKYDLNYIDLPFSMFAGGEGTAASPYLLSTPGDLMAIKMASGANFRMANDIDMGYTPWAGTGCAFDGVLDGAGYAIKNLSLTGAGIFESLTDGASVYNLKIEDATHYVGPVTSGVLSGNLNGGDKHTPTISNIHVSGLKAVGDGDALYGGLIGNVVLFSVISDCSVTDASIELGDRAVAGGLIGQIGTSSQVVNCLFDGWINAGVAGGIAGESLTGDEHIDNCHVHADINGVHIAGGVIGESSRTFIKHCFVDANIKATGMHSPSAGGIAGAIKSAYGDNENKIIEHCLVTGSVTANSEAEQKYAHRIAGFTSGDEWLVDWNSKDPNVDWSDPSTYPYVKGSPEKALADNYAFDMPLVDAEAADEASSAEGATVTRDEITVAWLSNQGWLLGNDNAQPWKEAGTLLALYYENFALKAMPDAIEVNGAEEKAYVVTFTCASRYASLIEVTCDNTDIVTLGEPTVSEDGYSIICPVNYVAEGKCNVTATLDDETAVCEVSAIYSGINDVTVTAKISYDGSTVAAEGMDITVYNTNGIAVARGYESVSVKDLPRGIYIANASGQNLKFTR